MPEIDFSLRICDNFAFASLRDCFVACNNNRFDYIVKLPAKIKTLQDKRQRCNGERQPARKFWSPRSVLEVQSAELGASQNFASRLLHAAQTVVVDQLLELKFLVEAIAIGRWRFEGLLNGYGIVLDELFGRKFC